jgi:hypothetical protein
MRFKKDQIDKLPDYLQKQISRELADSLANMEPNTRNAPDGPESPSGFYSPCSIHFHSVRKRLADSDGISGKAAIDGLVHAKILPDDSPKYVKEVTHTQEKGDVEETIITIQRIEDTHNDTDS